MAHADCAFRMGKTHLICQDYALAANAGEFPCVLLADGCSSSPETDIGARLLARSALPYLACLPPPLAEEREEQRSFSACLERYHQDAIEAARVQAAALHLPDTCLDATLLTLAVQGSHWFASVFGDGVVAAYRRDNVLEVTVVSYLGGYPYYPNYLADAARKRALLQHTDNRRKVEFFTQDADGGVEAVSSDTCPTDAPCSYVMGDRADYTWVAILSDGIHSFTARTEIERTGANTPVPLAAVLRELLAFKTSTGQFVQRRMQKFQQQRAARGWQHHDDLALGVLHFGG